MSKPHRLLEALAILGAFIELSDRVANSSGAFDMQGALWGLHKSIQKSRPRLVKWSQEVKAEYEKESQG